MKHHYVMSLFNITFISIVINELLNQRERHQFVTDTEDNKITAKCHIKKPPRILSKMAFYIGGNVAKKIFDFISV